MCMYVLIQKYLGKCKKLIDVRYHQDSMDKDNYEFHHNLNDFEELDTGVCIDRRSSQVQGYDITYLAWATDLMPEEFDEDWVDIEREKIYGILLVVCQQMVVLRMHI